ncbi:hypothetical protein D3C87_2078060 [compost metagenome]
MSLLLILEGDLPYIRQLLVGKLAVVQIGIESALLQQLDMRTFFNNTALVHHQNEIGVADG